MSARRRAVPAVALAACAALLAGCTTTSAPPRAAPAPPRPSDPTRSAPPPPASSAAPSGAAAPGLARFYRQRLTWHACTPADSPPDEPLTGLQCTRVSVPLDYAHPAGRTLQIAVDRARTKGAHRIGALLVNPGGPGASGLGYAAEAATSLPATVRAHFDIVGFDPRGVGHSSPVDCVSDATLAKQLAEPDHPRTKAEVAQFVAETRAFNAGCGRRSGWLLPHLGTADAARDIDVIRAALGEPKLTYLGKSYGTLLGATYADEFPTHVRALVLDGAIDPTLSQAQIAKQQAAGFETDLDDFLADCARRTACPLGHGVTAVHTAYDGLVAGIARHPLPAPEADHGPLTVGLAQAGIDLPLYATSLWPTLRDALAMAEHGDGSLLVRLADLYDGRQPDGSYDNSIEAFVAIECADGPARYSVAQAAAFAASWARTIPHYGASEGWGVLMCDGWPAPPTSHPHALHARGAPPIVVVGTTRDPATPYAWAKGLAHQLDSGRLVTFVGDGHTSYGEGRSACLDTAVDVYLVALTPPKAGLVCH